MSHRSRHLVSLGWAGLALLALAAANAPAQDAAPVATLIEPAPAGVSATDVASTAAPTAPADAVALDSAEPTDHFAADPALNRGGTLEMQSAATVYGNEIHLRQLCRWSSDDAAVFTPIADLTLARLGRGKAARVISLDELRDLLHGANVNLATVRFCGAMRCTITRSDAGDTDINDSTAAVDQWAQQHTPKPAATDTGATLAAATVTPTGSPTVAADPDAHTLRSKLLADLAQRLTMSADDLDISFDPKDSGLLNLSESNFAFTIRARHVHDLGEVRWDVTLQAGGATGAPQRVTVNATARAWQQQLILTRPVSYRQILREDDVQEQRVLIETKPDAPVLPRSQVVGQEAARDLQTGTVMTARLIEPVPLVKTGQFVTVTLSVGTVQIRTVARAMESGCYGQTVKLRNEDTRDTFEATMIAPQQATMGTTPPDSGAVLAGDAVASN